MDTVQVFETKRAFVEWAASLSPQAVSAGARVFVGYDLMSWSLKATVAQEGSGIDWAITNLPLPIKKSLAKELWDTIQEENLCLFFFHEQYIGGILVAARNGVWRSLDDRFLPYRKDSFVEIPAEEAEKLLNNNRIWTSLIAESHSFGIGCRLLHATASRSRKEHNGGWESKRGRS